eukprot:6057838-Prymnesium_polylepis.1
MTRLVRKLIVEALQNVACSHTRRRAERSGFGRLEIRHCLRLRLYVLGPGLGMLGLIGMRAYV